MIKKPGGQQRSQRAKAEYKHTVTVPYSGKLFKITREDMLQIQDQTANKQSLTVAQRLNKVVPRKHRNPSKCHLLHPFSTGV